MEPKSISMNFASRELSLQTGKLARFASGSSYISFGDIHILVTATISEKAREGCDFLPLSVDYQDKYYASGKIKGSRFLKREGGRPTDDAILTARLIDRPLRPMLPKGMRNDVQIIVTVLSTDQSMNPGPIALTAASMALMLSGAPFEQFVSAVRIGRKNDELILMPSYEECKNGDLDLVVAGTFDAITMVECFANEISDEEILKALEFAHEHIKKLCKLQEDFYKQFKVKKIEYIEHTINEKVLNKVQKLLEEEMIEVLYNKGKKEFLDALNQLNKKITEEFAVEIEASETTEADIAEAVYSGLKKYMRKNVLAEKRRLDGRKVDEVRKVNCEVSLLPRTHGSGLFNRGVTQILSIVTLGGPSSVQIEDSMDKDEEVRFWHHYTFMPFATGEVKQLKGAGRREIGHGKLGEKALMGVLPKEADFPYVIAVVSETLSCNGSSSMGSVCAATLALMDAGVPIKKPVTGIAMGLIMDEETGKYQILSDIQAQEDFLGDMDFKVCGTENGITALQMDIKIKGLKISLLKEALIQAYEGRKYIWDNMEKAISSPRKELSKYAPSLRFLQIDENDIKVVIGKGGETIQKITKECGVEIDIQQSGQVTITAPDTESGNKAYEIIKNLTYKPKVGDVFDGKVVKIMDFGAFVELVPGKEGLVHISEFSTQRVNRVEDFVKVGQRIKVKLMAIDAQGRYSLSHKATLVVPIKS
jgi:polyribonucleotide nucleotidyltransferase